MPEPWEHKSDHDLLVEIHTTLRQVVVPKMNDHEKRLRKLETPEVVSDTEKRLRKVEVVKYAGLGALVFLGSGAGSAALRMLGS